MPTAKDLDLFQEANGSSGSSREDARLARSLGNIIDIPEQQVMSYIRTRDRNTVHKLQQVLQEMPSSPPSGSQTLGRSKTESPKSLSLLPNQRKQMEARLQCLGKIRSAYGDFHSSPALGGEVGRKGINKKEVFDGIVKRGYKQEFDNWKECASENQVRVLADTCRVLRYMNAAEKPPTAYCELFSDYPDHKPFVQVGGNASNSSTAVPIGSIYKRSEKDADMEKSLWEAHDKTILAATRRQSDWKDGTLTKAPKPTLRGTLDIGARPAATIQDVMKETSQAKRHDHRFVKPSETDWAMCGLTGFGITEATYELRHPKMFPGGGAPNRARLVKAKMARFAEEESRLRACASAPSGLFGL